MANTSELRQDLVSGDWVVIAPKRAQRPDQFKRKEKRKIAPIKGCLFEDPQKNGNGDPILVYPDLKKWKIQIIPNKYPVLAHRNIRPRINLKGIYNFENGEGFHDIVITRNHYKNFAHLDKKTALELFKIFQKREKMVAKNKYLKYFFIFHNWGQKAGASIFHPHYQILSLPIIPPDVARSLEGSARFYKSHKKCVHCEMEEFELESKKRLVYKNKDAIVFTPFASKEPFELRVFPRKHLPYFENTDEKTLKGIIDALQKSLLKLEKNLGDPDYIFFIHTAPLQNKKKYTHYHWHIEIQPKIRFFGGFEVGTGIDITMVKPEQAAKILRG